MRPIILVGSLFVAGCETQADAPVVRSPPMAQPAVEVARPITLAGGSTWDCIFPAQSDVDKIDEAVVTLSVVVRADGTPSSVRVVKDPGHDFGAAARGCALAKRYQPALDRAGAPVVSATLVNVRFWRPPPDGKP
jgi:protein TonB